LPSKSKNTLIKIFLFFTALILVPLAVALVYNFPLLFSQFQKISFIMVVSILGFFAFIIFYLVVGPPVKSYIIEHELTHIIFAILSGIKVKKVSLKNNAHVTIEKVNLLIALSPYSLPLYTIIILSIYKFIAVFYNSSLLSLIFYFIASTSLSFHVVSTIHYLKLDQPDLKRYGYFSSLVFIFIWSVVIMALLLAYMFEKVELISYFRRSFIYYVEFYKKVLSFL